MKTSCWFNKNTRRWISLILWDLHFKVLSNPFLTRTFLFLSTLLSYLFICPLDPFPRAISHRLNGQCGAQWYGGWCRKTGNFSAEKSFGYKFSLRMERRSSSGRWLLFCCCSDLTNLEYPSTHIQDYSLTVSIPPLSLLLSSSLHSIALAGSISCLVSCRVDGGRRRRESNQLCLRWRNRCRVGTRGEAGV